MTLNVTLKQLKALGNEKVRAHNTKYGAGDNQFGVARRHPGAGERECYCFWPPIGQVGSWTLSCRRWWRTQGQLAGSSPCSWVSAGFRRVVAMNIVSTSSVRRTKGADRTPTRTRAPVGRCRGNPGCGPDPAARPRFRNSVPWADWSNECDHGRCRRCCRTCNAHRGRRQTHSRQGADSDRCYGDSSAPARQLGSGVRGDVQPER